MADQPPSATTPNGPPTRRNQPPRLLVVDANQASRETTGERLRSEGYSVVLAASGEIALERLATMPADAMVVEVVMPGLGGIEVCRRARRISGREQTIIVLLASMESPLAQRLALEAGADEVVARTPDLALLRGRLRDLLQRPRSRPTSPSMLAVVDPTRVESAPPSERGQASGGPDSARIPESRPPNSRPPNSRPPNSRPPPSSPPQSRNAASLRVSESTRPPPPSGPPQSRGARAGATPAEDAPPPPSRASARLFADIVTASGLPRTVATSTLEHACRRAGVNPASMSPADVLRALPAIRTALAMFVEPSDIERRVRAITAVAFPVRTPDRPR